MKAETRQGGGGAVFQAERWLCARSNKVCASSNKPCASSNTTCASSNMTCGGHHMVGFTVKKGLIRVEMSLFLCRRPSAA